MFVYGQSVVSSSAYLAGHTWARIGVYFPVSLSLFLFVFHTYILYKPPFSLQRFLRICVCIMHIQLYSNMCMYDMMYVCMYQILIHCFNIVVIAMKAVVILVVERSQLMTLMIYRYTPFGMSACYHFPSVLC